MTDLISRAAVLAALRRPRDGCMCGEKNVLQIQALPADAEAAAALAWAEAYTRRIDVPFDLWKARVTIAEDAYRAARGSAPADVGGRDGEG